MRRLGAFTCFANPAHSSLDAYVFWTEDTYQRVVTAHVCNRVYGKTDGVVSLGQVRCRKTLLKTANGEQYLLFVDKRRIAQVKCIGESINIATFSLKPVLESFPDVEGALRLTKNLANLYRNRNSDASYTNWTTQGLRHRNALVAFDCRSHGYSYRQIAVFIHGENATDDEWNNPSQTMKNSIIRSVKRGRKMVGGGYKTLLK